ncbi:MAG: amidase [Deltaproteobacteria bacterium]|nr:amidase [Deltaproteobacteria bacterium]
MTEPRDLLLTEMCELMKKGELQSIEIVESCLKSFDALNDRLKAFISIDKERILNQARSMDSQKTNLPGKLWGIPIAVKDLIDVAGEITTQGSSFFRNAPVAGRDASIIERLKKAGAISFGKTNLHEFALGGTSSNPHFGICRNPWNPDYIPGGSSGGSGAAVAARMVPGALGTDTLGSIRLPSALCGIVGLKPTYGLLPTEGIFPLGYTLDHVGPMVRSVSDAELLFKAMLTPDEHKRLEDIRKGKEYQPSVRKKLKGLKIALLTSTVQEKSFHKKIWAQYLKAITIAKEEGAEVVEENVPSFEAAISTAFTMTLAQASEIHYKRLAENPDGFGDDVRIFLEQGHLISAVDYIRAQRIRTKLVDEALKIFQKVDAWILPTTPNPATRVGEPPDPLNARFTGPINLLGFPSLAIPSGLTEEGLPVSIQIIAAPFHEYLLLEIARVFEDGLAFPKELPIWIHSQNY